MAGSTFSLHETCFLHKTGSFHHSRLSNWRFLPTDLRPKLVKFEFFSFFHGLELFYCKSLQVRKVTTNTFFDADSNKIVFRLDFFGPSEQFGFEASNSTKIPIVFSHFCFFC